MPGAQGDWKQGDQLQDLSSSQGEYQNSRNKNKRGKKLRYIVLVILTGLVIK